MEFDSVSIPLKSGLFVIKLLNIEEMKLTGLNPLKIGSVCNFIKSNKTKQTFCLNPLKIGSVCNQRWKRSGSLVSCLNPLKIGSVCNEMIDIDKLEDIMSQSP